MRRIYTLITLILLTAATALEAVEYKIDTNGESPDQTNSVYFDLKTKNIAEVDNTDWDLAFSTAGQATAVIHTSSKYSVFVVPNSSFNTFGTEIDTTGIMSWQQTFNDVDSWGYGSLNLGKDGFVDGDGDYGWGAYNPQTHTVTGNKVFIITDFDRNTYQLVIDGLYSGEYIFLWAELDGSNEEEGVVTKDNQSGSYLTYYDFETKTSSLMPEIGTWDFVLEEYQGDLGGGVFYGVTGIRTSPAVMVAEMTVNDPYQATAPDFPSDAWSSSITEIGHDWKTFDLSTYTYLIDEDKVYFIQRVDSEGNSIGDPYRFIPKAYEYGTNVFTFDLDDESSVLSEMDRIEIYPNIVTSGDAIQLPSDDQNILYRVLDMTGREILSGVGTALETNAFTSGKYIVVFGQDENMKLSQFIVR